LKASRFDILIDLRSDFSRAFQRILPDIYFLLSTVVSNYFLSVIVFSKNEDFRVEFGHSSIVV